MFLLLMFIFTIYFCYVFYSFINLFFYSESAEIFEYLVYSCHQIETNLVIISSLFSDSHSD